MAEAELEQPAAEEEPPPVAVVPLAFTFALTPAPSAAPPAETDGTEPPPPSPLEGTIFVARFGEGEGATVLELAHPLTEEGSAASATAELTVDEQLVRNVRPPGARHQP